MLKCQESFTKPSTGCPHDMFQWYLQILMLAVMLRKLCSKPGTRLIQKKKKLCSCIHYQRHHKMGHIVVRNCILRGQGHGHTTTQEGSKQGKGEIEELFG